MGSWGAGDGVVEFPNGLRVRGRGLRRRTEPVDAPEFGVYLTGREPRFLTGHDPGITTWPYRWVRWRDFRLPDSTPAAVEALREAYERAGSERVEIACGGGIGRTGTALAVLAVMSGVPDEDAIAWVRTHYHRRAVETPRQRRWVQEVTAALRP